ncbi:TPA: Dot/Icm T4SS effector CegC3 [Legionella pneumophila]|uniref:Dot/Icm T4SS effector CegC3 n=1 Tax=Legionella pneumophila TaxID=446 RepID=UPI0009312394|nr:Dot/Icm T4SS effector CegC3 [Legionella pneumophila]MBN5930381.1 Dot/Icm T4SS effector CegC3 [Legionella pneumophila]MCH9061104.1 Dot/Icm T4SS effector CegC3 [Legionella pneumophila serogroup 1]MCH9062378.1 Dot/Icm T4SS effector CegC3 [Legionella pneumophila serogroup 1]MCH9067006.1 Dot/Icm T4SS effector CegC3 [Legionella pneumophila serogroup 1]MCH9068451.1 Dot/Icm T4SS effector CegC3 [Legionella pneumophila serogroup 1]
MDLIFSLGVMIMPLTPPASPKTERRSEEDNQQTNQQGNEQGNQQPRSSILTLFGFTPNALVMPCPHGHGHFHIMDIQADDTLVFATMNGSPEIMTLLALQFLMQDVKLNVDDELAAETDAKEAEEKEEPELSSSESVNEEKEESEFSSSESESEETEEENEESNRFTM